MQNSAEWIGTTAEGYRVRVRFNPMNAQETERTRRLLQNFQVKTVLVTGQGPLSVDLFFTDMVDQAVRPDMQISDEVMIAVLALHGYTVAKEPAAGVEPPVDTIQGGAGQQAPSLTVEQQAAMNKPASKA